MYVDDLPRVALEYGAADDWTRDFLFPSPRSPYNPLVSNSTSETKTQNDKWSQQTCLRLQGHSSGNAVSIVEKLPLMLMLYQKVGTTTATLPPRRRSRLWQERRSRW